MRFHQAHHYRRITGRCLNCLTINERKCLVAPATARNRHHIVGPHIPSEGRQAEHRAQLVVRVIRIQPLHVSRQRLITLITSSLAGIHFLRCCQTRPDFIISRNRRTTRKFSLEERPFEGDAFAAGKGFRHMPPVGRQRCIRAGDNGEDH